MKIRMKNVTNIAIKHDTGVRLNDLFGSSSSLSEKSNSLSARLSLSPDFLRSADAHLALHSLSVFGHMSQN